MIGLVGVCFLGVVVGFELFGLFVCVLGGFGFCGFEYFDSG